MTHTTANVMRYDMALPANCAHHACLDLNGGTHGLWLCVDAAARLALHPHSEEGSEAAGDQGVMAWDLPSWQEALTGVHLKMIECILDAGANAMPNAAPLIALARQQGCDLNALKFDFGFDPLACLAKDGVLVGGPDYVKHQAQSLFDFAQEHMAQANVFCVSTEVHEMAGASHAQQLGIMAATLKHYLELAGSLGISATEIAERTTLRFAVGRDIFVEVAKLRAARLLFAKVLAEHGVNENIEPRLHVVSSRQTLSQCAPHTNMLRGTEQTFAALLANVDVVTTSCFDEALGQSSELARRAARNVAIILQEESNLMQQGDPTAGSYWVEENTQRLYDEGYGFMQQIEERGSMPGVLLQGWLREQIESEYATQQQRFATRADAVTGVSEYAQLDEAPINVEAVFGEDEHDFILSYSDLIDDCGLHAQSTFEDCIAASTAGANVFQISEALHQQQATQSPQMVPLNAHRHAEDFEMLRYQAQYLEQTAVHLHCLGELSQHSARKTFATNFFAAGGLDVDSDEPSKVVCICGSDAQYSEHLEQALAAYGDDVLVLVAGQFEDSVATLQHIHEVLA
jgi:methylmalonyl-CoA mutase